MILPDQTTVTAQLARYQSKAGEILQEWEKYDIEFVSDSDISISLAQVETLKGKVAQLENHFNRQAMQKRLHSVRLFIARLLGVHSLESRVASMLIATIPCAGVAIILATLKIPILFIFVIVLLCFISTSLLISKHLNPLDSSESASILNVVSGSLNQKREEFIRAKSDYNNAIYQFERAKHLRQLREEYEKTTDEVKRLTETLSNRRYQLLPRYVSYSINQPGMPEKQTASAENLCVAYMPG